MNSVLTYFHHISGSDVGVSLRGTVIIDVVLAVFLLACAYTDGTKGKIYNKVTFPVMALGLVLNLVFGGVSGLLWSLLGLACGLVIQWVPFILGFAKAGDVKMLMAVGALKGWAFCAFGFLYGAVAWAIIAVPMLWRKGELADVGRTLGGYVKVATATQDIPDEMLVVAKKKYMPWGVGLAVGFFLALALEIGTGRSIWFSLPW